MKTKTSLNRVAALFALALLAAPLARSQVTTNVFFFDDFNDPNSTSLGSATNTNNATSYDWVKGGAGGTNNARTALVSSNLVISNTGANGRDWAYVTLTNTSGFNTTFASSTATSLEWYGNMRQIRTDPSGFDSGNYGAAWVIGASSTNFIGAGVTGYALVVGQGGTTDPLRFVHFTNGLSGNSALTTIITATNTGADIGNEWLSLRLTYNVASNSWSLFGTTNSSFVDPWTNSSLATYGTASNSTYTGTSLAYMGALWNYATASSQTANFDNFRIAAVSTAAASPGNFWAGAAGGGGNGIWTSTSTNWATGAGGAGRGGTQATSGALVFTNTAGTVDVGGPVTVNAGMQFATDGYTVRSNTITLAGANAAANTITTDTGVGTTINSALAGSTGMTKAGAGTLTLGGANTYTGGTTVSGGRLVGDTLSLQGNIANTAALTFSQTTNGTYGGVISGTGGTVTKSGTGTVTFTQNNTYTGATTVSGGRLVVNGSQSSSAVTVNSGASLAGSGTVGGLTVSGLLAPGTSVGTLSAGSTTFEGGGSFELEIFDWVNVAGTGWDLFAITGDLTLNNTSGSPFTINLVSLANSTTPGLSTDWDQNVSFTNTFVTVSGSLLGTPFASNLFTVNTGSFSNTINGTFSITNVGNNLALLYTTSFVPATEYIWNTGAGAWGTGGSWSGGVAPSNNSAIIFSGAGGASTNNLVNTVQSLLFSNSAGSYTVSGDALTVGALGIDNESTAAQTINNNLTLGAAQSFLAANGDLTIGGTVNNAGFLLTVAGAANTTINGAISGAGGLTKNGAGSLVLAAANSYAGGTTINAGTVVGTTTSLQGNIANASFLEFSQAGDGTYSGAISGAGLVTKSGAGNVTFSGANSYSGGTIISGGTLTGSTASVPGDVDVSSGATFALDQTTNGTFSGLIEGSGRFVKAGAGNVTLEGASTYSGGTLVSGGTLTGTTSSLQGAITNNAAVVFNQAVAGTYSGAMSGNGSLTKSGAGSLTLSGANSYSGGTLVSAGALVGSTASLQGAITNNATVVMNQTTNGIYSGALSGSGGFTKTGSGTITLGGNNSSYNGAIDLQAGGLVAAHNNALGSSAVTMTNGSIQAASGVTVANNFTIGVSGGVTTNSFASTTVAGWDFSTNAGGAGNWGPSPMAPTTNAAGLSIVGLTRGSGLATTNAGAAGAWGANTWGTNITDASGAIAAGKLATFAITVSNGYALNLTNFGAYNVRRSGSGPTTGIWQWSTNGTDFTDIGTAITWGSTTTSAGNAQSAISITNINQLQALGGGSTVTLRVLNWGATGEAGTWYLNTSAGGTGTALDFLLGGQIATVVSNAAVGTGTLGISEAGTATFSGNIANNSSATLTAASGGTATFSGAISGLGSLTKTGLGTVTLSGASANTFTGTTTVSAGTLQLDKTAGTDALAGDVTVNSGAVLLISASNQVNDSSAVSLSGGTITRGSGVSEVFGNLNLTEASFLDFGTGTTGTLSFGTYTPSALLTINNFLPGNTLTFGSNLTDDINNTALFSFDNGFNSSWNSGTSTFTITAIPEPSTYLAAASLLGLMLWPSRKRIIRDAKKILGLRAPMRDRLAAKRA